VNDCIGNMCQNNATCKDKIGSYECECKPGFEGQYCENKIAFCVGKSNPCENEGVCKDHFTHFTCDCLPGFMGQNCSVNVDDCTNHMCQNGGVCKDGVNQYSCECPSEFTGKFCEVEPMVAHLYPKTSPCQQHDCRFGICMDGPGPADYTCKCSPGYSGKRCEYMTSLTFIHNVSYVELEPLDVKPSANVTFIFATKKQNGVLLYFGKDQHMAVELFKGRIRVSYDLSSDGKAPSTMFSYPILNDEKYHRVEFLTEKKNFTMSIDGGTPRSIISEDKKAELLQIHSNLFIAGVSEDVGERALKGWHLRNTTSFKGCLKEVYINGKQVDFLQAAITKHKVAPGCSMYQDEQPETWDPCANHKCQNGQCKPLKGSKSSYQCVCSPGYEGQFCQTKRQRKKGRSWQSRQRPTSKKCRKEKYKDYYIEPNGCRSVKPYKISNCVGDKSCGPTKTKDKAIRFVCGDGRKYKKTLQAVRRCGRKRDKWG